METEKTEVHEGRDMQDQTLESWDASIFRYKGKYKEGFS